MRSASTVPYAIGASASGRAGLTFTRMSASSWVIFLSMQRTEEESVNLQHRELVSAVLGERGTDEYPKAPRAQLQRQ